MRDNRGTNTRPTRGAVHLTGGRVIVEVSSGRSEIKLSLRDSNPHRRPGGHRLDLQECVREFEAGRRVHNE